jgi:hypothetical protein
LSRDGSADNFLSQIEVATVGGLPGLVCQLMSPSPVFQFLLLGVHEIFL